MDAEKAKVMLGLIEEKSKMGLIGWIPSSNKSAYQTTLGKGSITVWKQTDDYDENPLDWPIAYLNFINDRGEIFDSVSAYEYDETYEQLCRIYLYAHNSYMKTDETLKSMLDDLKDRL